MCKCAYTNVYLHVYLVSSYRAIPTFSFVDYIRGGCQISLMVAIDFTVSAEYTVHVLKWSAVNANMCIHVRIQ